MRLYKLFSGQTIISSPLTCHYNITTSIGTVIINNVEVVNCLDASFDVSSDGDYVLYLWAVDVAGNFNSVNSSFSVDTGTAPVVPPASNTGGRSGGSSLGVSTALLGTQLEIEDISAIVSVGEEKNLLVSVKNVGRVSANKCSLVAGEGYDEYVDSSDLFNIGVGEIIEFMFTLSVLDADVENLGLSVECLDNISADVPLDIVILKSELDVSIVDISFTSPFSRASSIVPSLNTEVSPLSPLYPDLPP